MKIQPSPYDPPDREPRQFSEEHEKLLSRLSERQREKFLHDLPALDFMDEEQLHTAITIPVQLHDDHRERCAEGGRFGAEGRWGNTQVKLEKLEKIEQEDRRLRQANPCLSKTDRAAIISQNFPELGAPGTIRKKLRTAR